MHGEELTKLLYAIAMMQATDAYNASAALSDAASIAMRTNSEIQRAEEARRKWLEGYKNDQKT